MTSPDEDKEWQAVDDEVERRLSALRGDPEALEQYDQAGDPNWEELRRIVTLEVQTEHQRQEQASHPLKEEGEVLRDRFELRRELGRGAQGRTYLGFDRQTESKVAVKELLLRDIEDWKAIELFEREAKTLRSLEHQAIPDYVDTFHLTSKTGERFFLVQEFVDGANFEVLIDEGIGFDEAKAKRFLQELLGILIYLHALSPPVIHRDIKPSNIMRRGDDALVLIDFGAVQSVIPNKQGGSTIIGTSGYMPMEQLMGRAGPPTDLYALGATVIHLLSRRHPADLPMEKWELQFEDFVNISDRFTHYLRKMTAPHSEERFATARQALAALPLPELQRQRRGGSQRSASRSRGAKRRRSQRDRSQRSPSSSTTETAQKPIRTSQGRKKPEPAEPTGEAIEFLNDRYELHRHIGKSDEHSTYLGYDLHTQNKIVVTEYLFEGIRKAKAIEIFNRHAKCLTALEHPDIPTYLDAFFVGSPRGKRYFLVQQFIEGQDFELLLDKDFSFNEEATRLFVQEVLDILVDIQRLSPPVVHANLTPSSVIVRPDDTLALVDFSAPWFEIAQHQQEPMAVGRAGYTPIEQVGDDFDMGTDLYALGATAMHLMSRQPPPAMPDSRWHREFLGAVDISPEFFDFLKTLMAYDDGDRFLNAVRARSALQKCMGPEEPEQSDSSSPAPQTSESSPMGAETSRSAEARGARWPLANWLNSAWFWGTCALVIPLSIVFAWPGYILFHDLRAERAIESGDFEVATKARDANCRAGAGLACAYLWGVAREVDPPLAESGAREACERDIPLGCANLADHYLRRYVEGADNERDLRQALGYAERGCDGESPTGCARLALVELYRGDSDRAQRSAMRAVGAMERGRHQYLPHKVLGITLVIDGEVDEGAHSFITAEETLGNRRAREQPILTVPLEQAITDRLQTLKSVYPEREEYIDAAIAGLE